MKVKLKCFALIKDIMGADELEYDLDEGTTAASLWDKLRGEQPRLVSYGSSLAYIVNEEFVDGERVLRDGDEIAFMPPVSGGASQKMFEVARGTLDTQAVAAKVTGDENIGAVVIFEGVGRRISRGQRIKYLEYDGYPEVAEKQLAAIGEAIKEKFGVDLVAITHRLGRIAIGETSVVIAVASPHRAEAFSASRYAIEQIKKVVPIWKKEVGEDGSAWIEGSTQRSL